MKKFTLLAIMTIICTNTVLGADQLTTVMHFTFDELLAFQEESLKPEHQYQLPMLSYLPDSVNLLPDLNYTPADYYQGSCGNCWQWTSSSCINIELAHQTHSTDWLSVQFINSCLDEYAPDQKLEPCKGGGPGGFVSFCSGAQKAIPWTNTNASFKDEGWQSGEPSSMSCGQIAKNPFHGIESIAYRRINTWPIDTGVTTNTDAINNIKNTLSQGKAIYLSIKVPNDFQALDDFYNQEPETTIFTPPTHWCSEYLNINDIRGHALTCVGYNDTDPENRYWIILNSWGTRSLRPNAIFRLDMDMEYFCYMPNSENGSVFNFWWYYFDVTYQTGSAAELEVDLWMPSTMFKPGDTCSCKVDVMNKGSQAVSNQPLFVILGILDEYYFAPSFNSFDKYSQTFSPGSQSVNVLNSFPWPSNCGTFNGVKWYAAFTDPGMTTLASNLSQWTFGWTDQGSNPTPTPKPNQTRTPSPPTFTPPPTSTASPPPTAGSMAVFKKIWK